MKLKAIDGNGNLITTETALRVHKPGDRYTDPETGKPLRFHSCPAGKQQPHFEFEPRWELT
jgi:hypothetical protein